MKILFGKPKLEYCPSVNGVPDGTWVTIDTPKEDSTSLETNEGDDLEAREEGGEIVDRIGQASSYSLQFELFKKKGEAFLLSDKESNGVISGEYAIRVSSAIDPEAPAYQIDRASVKTARLYSPDDTYRKQYTFNALKPGPTLGDTVKDVENTAVAVTASATSASATLIESGMTAPTTMPADWITSVSVSGTTMTAVITANSGASDRSATIELRGNGSIQLVTINQPKPAAQ